MNREVKNALWLSFIINLIMVTSNFEERTFDSYAHMFFADHYRRAWFSFWEPRWYGGFYIATYPPLAHQTIALFSFVISLEISYRILTLIIMTLFPLAIYNFAKIFVSDKAAGYSSLISALLPSTLTTIYIFGQFTTLFSLLLLLFSFHYFNTFLKDKKALNFVVSMLLMVSCICSHNFTPVFFLPFIFTMFLLWFNYKRDFWAMKCLIALASASLTVSVILLWPFVTYLLGALNGAMQRPIPHLSRINLFTNYKAFEFFFLFMHGPLFLFIPLLFDLAYQKKELLIPLTTALLLFTIGLGGTTCLPSILFGGTWELLTYDRFALWSNIVFLPLFGLLFEKDATKSNISFKVLLIALIITTSIILNASFNAHELYLPRKVNLKPIIEFLSKDGNWRWRYLTLEFGPAQMVKLSIHVNATTLDGFYVHGRTVSILKESAIETIDSSRYWKNGLAILDKILSEAEKYKIKFVFCNSFAYYDILLKNNFTLILSQENTRDDRLGGVTIWAREGVPQLSDDEIRLETCPKNIQEYLWGSIPLILALPIICLSINSLKNQTYFQRHKNK